MGSQVILAFILFCALGRAAPVEEPFKTLVDAVNDNHDKSAQSAEVANPEELKKYSDAPTNEVQAVTLDNGAAVPETKAVINEPVPSSSMERSGEMKLRKIYYINLDSATSRRDMQDETARKSSVQMLRHRAITANSLQDLYDNEYVGKFARRMKSFVARANIDASNPSKPFTKLGKFLVCVVMSHLSAMERAKWEIGQQDSSGFILILEDDVQLNGDFVSNINGIVSVAPPNWQMIRLGTWGEERPEDAVSTACDRQFYKAVPPFYVHDTKLFYYGGAHATLVRLDQVDAIIDTLLSQVVTDIDSMETNYPGMLSYAIPNYQMNDVLYIVQTKEQSHPPGTNAAANADPKTGKTEEGSIPIPESAEKDGVVDVEDLEYQTIRDRLRSGIAHI